MHLQLVWHALHVLFLAVVLSGCNMISSYDTGRAPGRLEPRTAGGSYFLAKHLVKVSIGETGIIAESVPVQDDSALMELGFNMSPSSHDTITARFEDGLLQTIHTVADDKTQNILTEIAQGIAGLRSAEKLDEIAPFAEIQFDPFDRADALQANQVIAGLAPGSCVEVELARGLWSEGCGRYSIGQSGFMPEDTRVSTGVPKMAPGIYYRRPMDHRVHVVFKGKTTTVETRKFANIAPVLRVDLDRTLFVKHDTSITFAKGELIEVKVEKPSEFQEAAKLPLAVWTAFLGGTISSVSKHKEVQEARAQLLAAQAKVLDQEAALRKLQIEHAARTGSISGITGGQMGIFSDAQPTVRQGAYPDVNSRPVRDCMENMGWPVEGCLEVLKTNQ